MLGTAEGVKVGRWLGNRESGTACISKAIRAKAVGDGENLVSSDPSISEGPSLGVSFPPEIKLGRGSHWKGWGRTGLGEDEG